MEKVSIISNLLANNNQQRKVKMENSEKLTEKKDLKFYWTMFTAVLSVCLFTFGGGLVIVPLLRKKFVEGLGWFEDDEMMDLVAIAQSTPGPVAINCSTLIGYRLAGIKGALLAVFAAVLPPLVIITIISIAYEAFSENTIVRMALRAMQAGIAAVIADVAFGMGQNVVKPKKILPIVIMVAAFIAAFFLSINVAYIIIACGLIGLFATLFNQRRARA